MSRRTTHAERLLMIERHQAGESLAAIAAAMHLNPYTVRTVWRHYRQHGWAGIVGAPAGPPQRGPLASAPWRLKLCLLRLKRRHPGWGVDKLRLELTRRASLRGYRFRTAVPWEPIWPALAPGCAAPAAIPPSAPCHPRRP